MNHDAYLYIETTPGLMEERNALRFHNLLAETAPSIVPEKYGITEPLRNKYDITDSRSLIETWDKEGFGLMMSRRKIRMEGLVGVSQFRELEGGSISISASAEPTICADMVKFVKAASVDFRGRFGCLHILTPQEVSRPTPPRTVSCQNEKKQEYIFTVALQHLAKYVPDVYWLMIFGRVYVDHFGREHLMSAPAHTVERLSDGSVCMTMSESPLDLITEFERVDRVRQAVKEHLNQNSFWRSDYPADHVYSVPSFK